MAQGYAQDGMLVAVDVPEHLAKRWKLTEQGRTKAGRPAEYLLPKSVARLAVEIAPGAAGWS